MKTITKLWLGVIILAVLSPLGLLLPKYFRSGDAWGEWGREGIKELVGYVPAGFEKISSLWKAPMPDYAFKGWEEKPLFGLSISYIFSALIGILTVILAALLIAKLLGKNKTD